MTLASQIQNGFTAVGGEVRALRGPLPSYAPRSGLKNTFDPTLSVYNLKASNTTKLRAGKVRVLEGTGYLDMLTVGDSSGVGYNGTSAKESAQFPRVCGQQLASGLGVPYAGGYASPCVSTGLVTDRWSATGTVSYTTYPGTTVMNGGSTVTYASQVVGTTVAIFYFDAVAWSYSIDGATAVSVPNGGTSTYKRLLVTGLTSATHTVKVNAPATGTMYLYGISVYGATGVRTHNMSWGGSTAQWNPNNQWVDTSSGVDLHTIRGNTLTAMAITPDLVVCCLGDNDMYQTVNSVQGDDPAHAIDGIRQIRSWYPSSDFVMVQNWNINGTPMAPYDSYWSLKYSLADELDVPLFDWRNRGGGSYTTANALGMIGADGVHETWGTSTDWGINLARGLLAA